jgi:lipopolysaccharide/colanic/teichoic acid biosynthesis glycosyltransferase
MIVQMYNGREVAAAVAPPPTPEQPSSKWSMASKRAADLALAALVSVPTVPVMILAMVLVKLTSPGSSIYSQARVGLHGRPFIIYKIRTMFVDSEGATGAQWSLPGDRRITRIGRILRATHADELPQLWNVFRGEMSLVGPRPERPEFVGKLEQAIPCYRDRLLVRPGVTGLAQVQLPPDTDFGSVRRKLACDLYYIREAGLWLDLRIVLSTACSLVGIPFDLSRIVLRIPSGAVVEETYRDLSAGAVGKSPHVQPA